jgi:STE24 endopeptidase
MRTTGLALLILVLEGSGVAWAQEAAVSTREEPASQAIEVSAGGVAMAPFDVAAATEAYLSALTPEEKERSDSYFEGGYWLQLWALILALLVAWLLLGSRLSARMRDLAERLTRRSPLRTILYVALYTVVGSVLLFPFTVYRDFFREHEYGLATQSFGPWMRDWLVELAVNVILFSLLAAAVYGAIRRSPRRWWLWASGVTSVFLILAMLIAPVFILPLFNDYTSLEDGPVRDAVLSLARANGVPADQVYTYDASRQTTRIGANVSGFLGTLRISLNDNLLNQGTLADVKAVVAHEIGHYVLHHVSEMLVYFAVLITVGYAFVYWAFGRVVARWGKRWEVGGVGDLAGLPLLVVLFVVYLFLMTPVINTIIRTNEEEADLFALNASGEPDGRARTAMMHAEDRKVDPGVIEEWIFFDHPSARNRVLMAMRWKAEHLEPATAGRPPIGAPP